MSTMFSSCGASCQTPEESEFACRLKQRIQYLMRPQSCPPMSYLVTVSVEIKNGTSGDYENVCAAFETLGLKRPSSGQSREAKLPTALVAGLFMGTSGAEIKDALGKAC